MQAVNKWVCIRSYVWWENVIPSSSNIVSKSIMFLHSPIVLFTWSVIITMISLVNGLNNFDKTDGEYLLTPTWWPA